MPNQNSSSIRKNTSYENKGKLSTVEDNEAEAYKWVKIIRKNVIGRRCLLSTPFGEREVVYADYTASGRSLHFIEEFMDRVVSPMYGNTHTEASVTGAQTTRFREEARDIIRNATRAPKDEYAVLFTGTGATGAIEKLISVLGIRTSEYLEEKWDMKDKLIPVNQRPVVFISHFEHHSNELPWREGICRCVVIKETKEGTTDMKHLEERLIHYSKENVPLIGSFSAGSNVTGIMSPVHEISKMLHKYGAWSFFDYAGVGAYVDIDMHRSGGEDSLDAIFLSPHKFVGGPGSSGVLIARNELFRNAFGVETTQASTPGGGTITYVTRNDHIYSKNIELREDSGTPGIMQSIRAGLVFQIKDKVGPKTIARLEHNHCSIALHTWKNHPKIALMGSDRHAYFDLSRRVSIISFNVLSPRFTHDGYAGNPNFSRIFLADRLSRFSVKNTYPTIPLHHNFVVALLNDLYGIQGRGGCSCAGPYGTDLLELSHEATKELEDKIKKCIALGLESFKPGWARVNFNYFTSEAEVDFIIQAINDIADYGWKLLPLYVQNMETGQFLHRSTFKKVTRTPYSIHHLCAFAEAGKKGKSTFSPPTAFDRERTKSEYNRVLKKAMKIYDTKIEWVKGLKDFTTDFPSNASMQDVWWLLPSEVNKGLLVEK